MSYIIKKQLSQYSREQFQGFQVLSHHLQKLFSFLATHIGRMLTYVWLFKKNVFRNTI